MNSLARQLNRSVLAYEKVMNVEFENLWRTRLCLFFFVFRRVERKIERLASSGFIIHSRCSSINLSFDNLFKQWGFIVVVVENFVYVCTLKRYMRSCGCMNKVALPQWVMRVEEELSVSFEILFSAPYAGIY